MRVLVVEGALLPTQMSHWESTLEFGVDLHLAGTTRQPKRKWPTSGVPVTVSTHVFEPLGWLTRGSLWWVYPGLRSLIADLKPDLIHVANEPWAMFYTQVLGQGPPVVAHGVENIWEQGGWAERNMRLMRTRHTLSRVGGFAAWNTAGIESAREYGLDRNRPTLLAPARLPDFGPFQEAALDRMNCRKEIGVGDGVAIGYVGRLHPEKGIDWLIRAFAVARPNDAELLIFGSGPQEMELRGLADRLGVRASFHGAVNSGQIPRVMAGIDLLVVPSITTPSWKEQFGRVVIEAMFAGTAVVSSDSGALPEVVGEGGIVVTEGDIDGLAGVIKKLVADSSQRSMIAKRGLSWANARYAPKVIARETIDFWEAVLSG